MPDVWTSNPEKLRGMLSEAGFRCGEEPRILRPRDAEWTCVIDRETWYGDVYIHNALDFLGNRLALTYVALALVFGLVAGYVGGKRAGLRR